MKGFGFVEVSVNDARSAHTNFMAYSDKARALRKEGARRLFYKEVTCGNWWKQWRHGNKTPGQYLNWKVGVWGHYCNVLHTVCTDEEMDIIDFIGTSHSMYNAVKALSETENSRVYAGDEMMAFINEWKDKE